jgi:hypothetical protein
MEGRHHPRKRMAATNGLSLGLKEMIRAALRLILLVALLASFLACGPTEKDRRQQAEKAHLQKTKALFASMIARHRASLDWNKQLKERLFAFSIDIQESIAAQPARPIVIFAVLRDIYSSDGKGYVVAEYEYSDSSAAFFVLEAGAPLLRSITSLESPKYDDFAFVVSPTGSSVAPPSDAVIVRGQLLDFLRLGGITAEQVTP